MGSANLDPQQAQLAVNTKLWSGELRPFFQNLIIQPLGDVGDVRSFYLLEEQWLISRKRIRFVPSLLGSEVNHRTYFTVDGEDKSLRVIDTELIDEAVNQGWDKEFIDLDSEGYQFYYLVGVPSPVSAPSVSTESTGEDENRIYVFTFVSEWGEESKDSPLSDSILVGEGDDVTITTPTTVDDDGYVPVTHKRIYRLNVTTEGLGILQYVDEIPLEQDIYTDNKAGSELGETIRTEDFDLPPDDLFGLIQHPAGYMIGFRKEEVCFSEPGNPYAWPVKYRLPTNYEIMAGGVTGNTAAVLTKAYPYLIYGSAPEESYLHQIPGNYGCINSYAVASTEIGIIFPNKVGLCVVRGDGDVPVITRGDLSPDEWMPYARDLQFGTVFDDKYFGFYSGENGTGGFLVDPNEPQGSFVLFDYFSLTTFSQVDERKLFFILKDKETEESYIVEYDGNKLRPISCFWKSRRFYQPSLNFAAGKVNVGERVTTDQEIESSFLDLAGSYLSFDHLESYSGALNGASFNYFDHNGDYLSPAFLKEIFEFQVLLSIYSNRNLIFRRNITNDKPFRMPAGFKTEGHTEYEISTTSDVQRVVLGTSMQEVANA